MGRAMLSTACPKCGRPAPLSLAAPDRLRCPTCGHAGTLPAAVQAQLQGAHRILQSMGARDRQLTAQQQRSLTSSRGATVGYWLTTAVVSLPLLLCGLIGNVISLGTKQISVAGALVSIAPLALFAVVAIVGQRAVKKRYAALRIACAALPPSSPGQPAACHVCGAPLGSSSAVVRCGFCQADNLIAPDALAAAASARATLAADFEGTVRRQATLTRAIANQATLSIVMSAVGAPFFTFVLFFVAMMILSQVEGPIDASYRYGIVNTPSGRCVAWIYQRSPDKKWLLNFGTSPPEGWKAIEVRDSVDDVPALTASDLEGKRVKPSRDGKRAGGVIERVHGTQIGGNRLVIGTRAVDPQGVCLDEP